ncbi:hypothetical protein EDB84DRAFT_1567278 [Lactarius hengduanensis]|nr:hypothetical protein EDB84DRAFT_1567278 [Lactarius hengduanensis]
MSGRMPLFPNASTPRNYWDHTVITIIDITTAKTCCVGERTCEGNDLYHEMIETGIINLEGDSKVALASEVSTLLGCIPSAVGYQPTLLTDMGKSTTTTGKTFEGSITSVQAASEVSALLGCIPSAVGYQPTLSTDMSSMKEHHDHW